MDLFCTLIVSSDYYTGFSQLIGTIQDAVYSRLPVIIIKK